VPVYDPFGDLAAAISVVVEAARAKPQVLVSMLADASGEITRRLAAQSGRAGQRLPATVPPRPVARGRGFTSAPVRVGATA
jgi:DNA-binding IclR family transcriptional regulator